MFKVKIHVVPKKNIADPQGSAVKDALGTIGFSGIEELRIGKIVEIKLDVSNRKNAEIMIEEMCEKLIVNPLIEEYSFEFVEESI